MLVLAQAAEATGGANTAEIVLFWVFAVLALGSALAVISMRNIVHGALMLVLNLLAIAGLYLTLESSFLAIIQVLVYAGAIMVLFLFVIMLLGVDRDDLLTETHLRTRAVTVLGGALLAGALLFAFVGTYTSPASLCGPDAPAAEAGQVDCVGLADAYEEGDDSGVAFLGLRMFTRFTWPFELAALMLTVVTIGAVILARRRDLEPEDVDELDDDGSTVAAEVGVPVVGGDTPTLGASAAAADDTQGPASAAPRASDPDELPAASPPPDAPDASEHDDRGTEG